MYSQSMDQYKKYTYWGIHVKPLAALIAGLIVVLDFLGSVALAMNFIVSPSVYFCLFVVLISALFVFFADHVNSSAIYFPQVMINSAVFILYPFGVVYVGMHYWPQIEGVVDEGKRPDVLLAGGLFAALGICVVLSLVYSVIYDICCIFYRAMEFAEEHSPADVPQKPLINV